MVDRGYLWEEGAVESRRGMGNEDKGVSGEQIGRLFDQIKIIKNKKY